MIIDKAKPFWTISRRYHANRLNPAMPGVAVRDMRKLETPSLAVQKRVNRFIAQHHKDGGGNSVA